MRAATGRANTSRHPGSPSRMAPCSKLNRNCMVWGNVSATTVAPRSDAAELAAQLGLQLRPEPRSEDVVGRVEQGHLLVRPDRLDLAGQLNADRPRAEQQHPLRRRERRMGDADLVVGGGRSVEVALGRERIRRPGRQHDVIRRDLLAGGERHPAGVDLHGPAADHPAARQQPVVGQVNPRQLIPP